LLFEAAFIRGVNPPHWRVHVEPGIHQQLDGLEIVALLAAIRAVSFLASTA